MIANHAKLISCPIHGLVGHPDSVSYRNVREPLTAFLCWVSPNAALTQLVEES